MTDRVCSVEGCERKHRSKGYCQTHYHRQLKGRPLEPKPILYKTAICCVDGCDKPYSAKGMCKSHYFRSAEVKMRKNARRRKGNFTILCSICRAPFQTNYKRSNNYCSNDCYRKSEPLRTKERMADKNRPRCQVDGCERPMHVKGLCGAHFQRKRHGISLKHPLQKKAKGRGEWSNGYGYVIMNTPHGLMMKHRYLMELKIGRKLLKCETVHHLNGVRDDNRIENLELWHKSHPSGQRVIDKLAWCKAFIAEYEPLEQAKLI